MASLNSERSYSRFALIRTFERFTRKEASGGLLLIGCALLALVWANSPLGATYSDLWATTITVDLGAVVISKQLLLWINDGLMAIFFFVIGLEIKREMLHGELGSIRQAALPLAAALGGMLVPAALYLVLNWSGAGLTGWAIPMATDIAFALGVLALLGDRAPLALKLFLTALAIVDDLGAVLVIAIFYTAQISTVALSVGGGLLLLLIVANQLGVRSLLVYGLIGIAMWIAVLKSGVHATVAGVTLALTVPARTEIDAGNFVERSKDLLGQFLPSNNDHGSASGHQDEVAHSLQEASRYVQSPLTRAEHALHPWVAYFILPVFALANAGVVLSGEMLEAASVSPIMWGIVLGLVVGKQFGVTAFAWGAVQAGWAVLPEGVNWRQIYGTAWLTGIGFTMSLFIGGLSFADPQQLDTAKIGVMTASVVSGAGGWWLLRTATSPTATLRARAGNAANEQE